MSQKYGLTSPDDRQTPRGASNSFIVGESKILLLRNYTAVGVRLSLNGTHQSPPHRLAQVSPQRRRISTTPIDHTTLLFVAVFVTMVSFWGAPTGLGIAIATLMVLMMPQQARGHTMHTRPISRQYSRSKDFLDT